MTKKKNISSKFVLKRDGPYRIREFHSDVTCDIETIDKQLVGKYHVSHLAAYNGESDIPPAPLHPIRRRGRPSKQNNEPIIIDQNSTQLSDEGEGFQGFTDEDVQLNQLTFC